MSVVSQYLLLEEGTPLPVYLDVVVCMTSKKHRTQDSKTNLKFAVQTHRVLAAVQVV